MADFIEKNMSQYTDKIVGMTCHNIHWERIKFLLTSTPPVIVSYYFEKLATQYGIPVITTSEIINLGTR